jgi:hypothetical protein
MEKKYCSCMQLEKKKKPENSSLTQRKKKSNILLISIATDCNATKPQAAPPPAPPMPQEAIIPATGPMAENPRRERPTGRETAPTARLPY